MQEDTLFLFFIERERFGPYCLLVMTVRLASCDGHFLGYSMHVSASYLRDGRLPKNTRTHMDSKNVSTHDVLAPT